MKDMIEFHEKERLGEEESKEEKKEMFDPINFEALK